MSALVLALAGCGEPDTSVSAESDPSAERDPSAIKLDYDPAADPFAQVAAASRTAVAGNKHILLVAGGEWCVWCYYLEDFLGHKPEVADALHDTFVVVHVNFSDDNRNEKFFATLPEAPGYPHFWVLDKAGQLLESQDTYLLEDGDKSYDTHKFVAFVDRWRATLNR